MDFKLDQEDQEEALKLKGSKVGIHLYAPEKPIKGWVSIPKSQSDKWIDFAKKALKNVEKLEK